MYEPSLERASLEQIRKIQANALRRYLVAVSARIPNYADKIVAAGLSDPYTVEDAELFAIFSSLPLMDGKDYVAIDYAALVATDRALYYLESTSGTTSAPKSRYVTVADDSLDQQLMARSLSAFGLKVSDRLLTVDLGDLNFHSLVVKGLSKLGIRDSIFYSLRKPFARAFADALSCNPSVLMTIPSILMRSMPDLELSLRKTPSLNKLVYYCEPLDISFERYLYREFGIESFSLYSSIETGLIGAECSAHDGLHVWLDALFIDLAEKVTPAKHDFTQHDGVTEGSLAITTLSHLGKPTLRYLLGDRVQYTQAPCLCGRTLPRLRFVERDTDNFSIYGTKFSFRQVYQYIYNEEDVSNFLQIVVSENQDSTTLTFVLPETINSSKNRKKERLYKQLGSQPGFAFLLDHNVLNIDLRFVESEYFTRRKIKRVTDKRNPLNT
ncbi:MAG TPA: hypothetical protein VJU84_11595 [Pyrinomonadaceae bacterium]|nr:hypothetical protein [Pyrinomonadaceae bacterium]